MIINSHVHVNTNKNYFFYHNYGLMQFLQEMHENNIDIAFPAINPKVGFFRCPNDCSMHCGKQVNNNLNNCHCKHSNRHRVGILEENASLVIRCKTCGKTLLTSTVDALRDYNIALIQMTRPYRKKIKPLLYIALCKTTIQAEIDFFEKNFPHEFVGFKLHPWNDQVSVADFKLHTTKPILIHTGVRDLESAKNAAIFAKNNPELKVVIAHAAALDEEVLKEIAQLDNAYIDCCPSCFLYASKSTSLFSPQDILTPEDIYYKALDFLPSNKILFGTDSPWGNSKQELAVVSRLQVPADVKEEILYQNATKIYLQ